MENPFDQCHICEREIALGEQVVTIDRAVVMMDVDSPGKPFHDLLVDPPQTTMIPEADVIECETLLCMCKSCGKKFTAEVIAERILGL